MKLALGADHGGYELKGRIAEYLRALGHEVEDLGTFTEHSVDYPDLAAEVARRVSTAIVEAGILVCGTGQGMAMTANRFAGVRAAVVSDTFSARMSREHNDANVLCLGARVVGPGLAHEIVDAWLNARFEGGRHERRVARIEAVVRSGTDPGGDGSAPPTA